MKKYIFMAIVAIAAVFNAYAEQGDVSLGAQFVYASKHSMAGLGAQYRINERLHFFTEERFQIMKDFNQSVTALGLKYTF